MKKYLRNKIRGLMMWYVPVIASEVRKQIVYDLVSRVSLDSLKKMVEEAELNREENGSADYSLLAEMVLKISKY